MLSSNNILNLLLYKTLDFGLNKKSIFIGLCVKLYSSYSDGKANVPGI
jgi:hypothetical protein